MTDTFLSGTTVEGAASAVARLAVRLPLRAAGATISRAMTSTISGPRAVTVTAGTVPTVHPTEPPGGQKLMTVVGWVGWGVFAAAVAGVLIICIRMATNAHRNRTGDGGGEEAGKLFWPLLACIVGSSAGAILGVVA